MKAYRTRYSILLIAILAACTLMVFYTIIEAMQGGKASEVFSALGIFVFFCFIVVGATMTNYIIDDEHKQLVIANFFGLMKTRVDIMKMTRVRKTNSIMSAPASSLKRICIEYSGGRFKQRVIISPYMQDDFLQELKKLNPELVIEPGLDHC